jgi:hypothetical protein
LASDAVPPLLRAPYGVATTGNSTPEALVCGRGQPAGRHPGSVPDVSFPSTPGRLPVTPSKTGRRAEYDHPPSLIETENAGRLMKLPNARLAIVEDDKVVSYLLNPAHRFGGSKARFFADFGFRLDDWEALARALREHGRRNEAAAERETGFGPRYEVDGPLNTPDGRRPRVRTVWQLDEVLS